MKRSLNLALISVLAATMGGPMVMNRRRSEPVSYLAKFPESLPDEEDKERLDAAQAKRDRKAKAR